VTDTARLRADRTDVMSADHYPECPSCGDLCGVLAEKCSSCGAYLYPSRLDLAAIRNVGLSAMRKRRLAALLREDAETRKGKAI
jgi:ribosomal protein L32